LFSTSSTDQLSMDSKPDTGVTIPLPPDKLKQVRAVVDALMLTEGQVSQVMTTLQAEMWDGLSRDQVRRKNTSLQMENTYVRSLLNGKEDGDFLALDLGGTNFRVLMCKMRGGVCESISRNYNVPIPKLHGPAIEVFDHLAESIFLFMKEENILDKRLPLGFTFSFPMVQEGLNKGILVTWTKSFACPDGVGQDAVKMLEEAIDRRGDIKVDVVAVLNDTTGTLMAGSYLDKKCGIGLIMGTGCNAAYVEKINNVEKWEDKDEVTDVVVIDIEWGAFGDNGSLDFTKTEFDEVIDAHSNWKGSFTFEKLFAGHYIGDLARLVLLRLTEQGLLFGGHVSEQLKTWKSFTAAHLSNIVRDTEDDTNYTDKALEDLGLKQKASNVDKAVIRHLCWALTHRATQFISASLAVLLNHMKWSENTIAIDGSLYRYHPYLHDMMTEKLAELAPDYKCKLILAEDGSGRGAAFVAAVAVRMQIK